MNISIQSILLGLGGKCLLNWSLVFLQRSHICSSFVGIFGVSLSIVDTALTLIVTTTYISSDRHISLWDLHLTRYHTCLLVQILGEVYSALQWPVALVACLDHFCTISLQPASSRAKWIVHSSVTFFLWYLAAHYVFLLSDFTPVLEDVSHHQLRWCWDSQSTQIFKVATAFALTLGCAALHAECSTRFSKNPPQKDQITKQGTTHSRRSVVCQVLRIFLDSWALFFVFLAVLFMLPVGLPSYLDLNVAWLSFLNSFLIAVILCVACPASQLAQGWASVPADSFCEWRFKFSLAAEDRT